MTQDRPGFRRSSSGPARPDGAASTGPFTHGQIVHLMKTEFARARRHAYPVSCMLLQADRLREFADLYGSDTRAEVRRQLGVVIDEKTRGHDHLGSISDGVHLLVLAHTEAGDALAVADRIRARFRELVFEIVGNPVQLTVSIGVASCEDQDTMFFETLVSQAEVALEWATRAGGDQVVLFERERFVKPV